MNEKEKKIIEAAIAVFHRYGVKRASMADIAEAAGVSRQTVYNAFANKDDILRGSIRLYTESAIPQIEARIAGAATLSDKISAVLEFMVVRPFTDLHASPNAQDLLEGYNAAGKEELEKGYCQYRGMLGEIFEPYSQTLKLRGLTPAVLAETLQRAATGFKYVASDAAHLDQLLRALIGTAVAATEAPLPSSAQTA